MKRKRRKNISTTLTTDRADNLIGGVSYYLLSRAPGKKLFDSDLQRRAVYFANREKLINQALEEIGPGCRPEGFWDYEHPAAGVESDDCSRDRPGLKYLVENDLLLDGEYEEVLTHFFFILNGPCPTGFSKELEWHANALGGKALEAYNEFKMKQEKK